LGTVSDSTTTVVATAPTVALTISGTAANQTMSEPGTISLFAHVAIADANFSQTETVTVTLSAAANGTLTNLGLGTYNVTTGIYTVTGSAPAVTAALDALLFTPKQSMPAESVTTGFAISDIDTASRNATDSTTSVVATAPAVAPTISGAVGGQQISAQGTTTPFTHVAIADANFSQTETVTVTLSAAANGKLTNLGGGTYNAATGIYTVTGSAPTVTAALDALLFTPTQSTPAESVTTGFAISDIDTASREATDSTTTVVATAPAVAPTISGAAANQAMSDQGTISPFANVVIADANFSQTETVTVTLSAAANGKLTNLGGGTYNAATGIYTVMGSAPTVTAALVALLFTPTLSTPAESVTTDFVISDLDTASRSATDSTTTVVAAAPTVALTISGAPANQAISDQATISPFANVAIADPNFGQTETVTVTLSAQANGTLTNPAGGSYNAATGVYTVTGGASAVTAALDALLFTPTQSTPGQSVTTGFTISDIDSGGQTVTDSTTTVVATAPTVAPTISGSAAGQAVSDQGTISPFAHVAIADANFNQTETVTVTPSSAANGTLTNLSGGTYDAATGVYTDTGPAAAVSAALNGLVFVPTQGEVAGGQTVTTKFSISSTDTASATVTDATTSVVATAVIAPPGEVILSGSSPQYAVADDSGSLYVEGTVTGAAGAHVLSGTTVMAFTNGVGVFDPTGTAEDVARLYLAALNRAPDVAGLEGWTALIDNSNVALSTVGDDFTESPEFIHDYGALSNSAYVQQLYLNVLGRAAEPAGLQGWTNALASGETRGDVLTGFSQSSEFERNTISIAGEADNAEAYRLYTAALNRTPDPAGLAGWSADLAGGASPTQVAQGFIDSAEFQHDYEGLSVSDFVSALYENVLHRAGDPAGQQAWTNFLLNGGSESTVLIGFSDGVENRAQTAAATHANWVFIPS
jgi:hypothetical protein